MKRLITVFAMTVSMMAFAVSATAQISVGAGYGLASNVSKGLDSDGKVIDSDREGMSGFYIGAAYEWNFLSKAWGDLSLQPGITYSYFGESESDRGEIMGMAAYEKEAIREHYLDVPVNVRYSYNLLPGTLKLSAYAGPVFSFGLASTAVSHSEVGDDWTTVRTNLYTGRTVTESFIGGVSSDSSTDGGDTGYGMFDLKLGVGVAATVLEKFDVKIGYNIGLLDRMSMESVKYHTGVFHVGLAYNF